MSVDALEDRVTQVAAEVLGTSPSVPVLLELDSLGQAELAFALEEAFGVRLRDGTAFGSMAEAAAGVAEALKGEPVGPTLGAAFGRLQWLGGAMLGPLRRAYRLEVLGADRVPRSGPAIVAMNHDSLLDIPFMVLASLRPVWFMAKVELFKGPLAAWFFHVLGGFPVRRGASDIRAVRAAIAVVRSGRLLGMYPEGTRAPHLQPFLPGAAWLALATGAPLVPAAITGTAQALPRGSALPRLTRVRVSFGEPMAPGREDVPQARLGRARLISDDLRGEVERLLAG